LDAFVGVLQRNISNEELLSHARIVLQQITSNSERNAAHIRRIMPPKLARRMGKLESPAPDVAFIMEHYAKQGWGVPAAVAQETVRKFKETFDCNNTSDVVADVVAERAQQKLKETCQACGKTAAELGKNMLKCSACTLAPFYCGSECQKAAWPAHKAECKANRKESR
jgi:hypothetical protein